MPSAQENLNCFFIVGAPRAGTTALGRYLKTHPKICFSDPKETHYFLTGKDNASLESLKRRYLKAFFPNVPEQVSLLGEGSVSTLYSAEAITRVLDCFPQAKFIVMLRNPLDLLRSYHGRMFYLRQENEVDFETAWDLQENRAAGEMIPKSCHDARVLQYREVGRLGYYTRQLFDLVGRQNCLAIFFEDFVSDTLSVYKETLQFLNLPYDGRTKFKRMNSQRRYSNAFWQNIYGGPLLRPVGNLLKENPQHLAQIQRITRPVRRMIKRKNSIEVSLTALDPKFKARLVETLGADIDSLSHLLDRDLTHWITAAISYEGET